MLCTFDSIPRAIFILQRKHTSEVVVEHDSHIPLNVRIIKAIPELCMTGRMSIRSQILQSVIEKILVLPITEVGTGFAKRMIDLFNDDPDVDRIGGKSPVVFQR